MRKLTPLPLIFLLLLLAGCSTSRPVPLALAVDGYTAVRNLEAGAIEGGKVTADQARVVDAAASAMRKELDKARADDPTGMTLSTTTLIESAKNAFLNALAETLRGKPATRPSDVEDAPVPTP